MKSKFYVFDMKEQKIVGYFNYVSEAITKFPNSNRYKICNTEYF